VHSVLTRFNFFHAFLPFAILLVATLILDYFGGDLLLADALYGVQGDGWNLKENWLLEGVIHKGGRTFVALLVTLAMAGFVGTWFIPAYANYRRGLSFLLGAVVVSLLVVSSLKAITHIDCPWSLQRYGGEIPAAPIFSTIFGSGTGRCFPAGHASGGYAWVALYFLCLLHAPRWRFVGLGVGLTLGFVFGGAQQLRGAHLLSHDLWTLAVCWYSALGAYCWVLRQPRDPRCAS